MYMCVRGIQNFLRSWGASNVTLQTMHFSSSLNLLYLYACLRGNELTRLVNSESSNRNAFCLYTFLQGMTPDS